MSTAKPIDFWFAIGSTYTYLAVSRIDAVEAAAGVTFRWRPFNIRHVLIEHNNTPYPDASSKSAYMWRDIERWCGLIGYHLAYLLLIRPRTRPSPTRWRPSPRRRAGLRSIPRRHTACGLNTASSAAKTPTCPRASSMPVKTPEGSFQKQALKRL